MTSGAARPQVAPPSTDPPANGAVRVVSAEADNHVLVKFIRALREDGHVVEMSGMDVIADGTATVVVLSDALVSAFGGTEAATSALEVLGTAAIPVTTGPHVFNAVWPDRSQLPVVSFGVARAARRVALVARVGQEALVAWNSLHGAAARWLADSKPVSGLLRRDQIADAEDLIRQPVAELPDADPGPVRDYIVASRQRAKAIRRRAAAIVAIAVLFLLAASGLATAQGVEASRASAVAEIQARSARADRLADIVDAELGTDPDLPWILAAEALDSAQTPKALETAQRVLDNSIPHRSIATREPAVGMAVLAGGKVLLGYPAGLGFDLLDLATGRTLRTQLDKGTDGPVTVSASPDQSQALAISTSGKAWLVVDGEQPKVSQLRLPDAVAAGNWVDMRRALVRTKDGVAIFDAGTLSMNPLAVPSTGSRREEIAGVLGDLAGGWLAIAYGDRVEVWPFAEVDPLQIVGPEGAASEPGNPRPALTIPADTPQRLGLTTATGVQPAHLMVDANRAILAVSIGEALARPADLDSLTTTIRASGGTIATDGRGVTYTGDPGGFVGVIMPGADYQVDAVAAHNGPVTAVEVTGTTWLSAGADKQLRIWQTPAGKWSTPARSYGSAEGLQTAGMQSGLEESDRTTVVSRGEVLTTAIPAIAAITQANKETLTLVSGVRWTGPSAGLRAKLSENGSTLAWVSSGGSQGRLTFARWVDGRWQDSSSVKVGLTWSSNSLVALSQEGGYFAACANNGLTVWRTDSPSASAMSTEFDPTGQPVQVSVDDKGKARCVDSSGVLRSSDGASQVIAESATALRSAGWAGDDLVTVDASGVVRRFRSGETRDIGRIAPSDAGFAVRIDPTGTKFAIIGTRSTVIYDATVSRVVNQFGPLGVLSGEWPVQDVLFDADNSVILARSNGWLERRAIGGNRLGADKILTVPRQLNEMERLALHGNDGADS